MSSIRSSAFYCLVKGTHSRSTFSTSAIAAHGVKLLGVVGVGQLGLGIAYVAAKVGPLLDRFWDIPGRISRLAEIWSRIERLQMLTQGLRPYLDG